MKQNIMPMAGCCMELALWQIIRDLSRLMLDGQPLKITVDDVFLEDDCFGTDSQTQIDEATAIWYLGALLVYMSSGHEVFGGRGIEYQKKNKSARLPVLCKEHSSLTGILHACINAEAKNRMTFSDLYKNACTGFEDCCNRNSKRKIRVSTKNTVAFLSKPDESLWPEEME